MKHATPPVVLLLVGVSLASVLFSARASGEEAPWPSDQSVRLEQLDSQVLETRRKLVAARRQGDAESVEALTKQYKAEQDERLKLLRATNQLPH